MIISTPFSNPCFTASYATADGSVFMPNATTGAPTRSPHSFNCSTAAARNVSAAPSKTDFPFFLNCAESFPIVVVLPTPFTPTTISTYGFLSEGVSKSGRSSVWLSESKAAISSFRILSSSVVPTYLSFATLASIRPIIFKVVSTPTSDEMRISSRLSSTSASTVDLPTMALPNLLKKLSLVF